MFVLVLVTRRAAVAIELKIREGEGVASSVCVWGGAWHGERDGVGRYTRIRIAEGKVFESHDLLVSFARYMSFFSSFLALCSVCVERLFSLLGAAFSDLHNASPPPPLFLLAQTYTTAQACLPLTLFFFAPPLLSQRPLCTEAAAYLFSVYCDQFHFPASCPYHSASDNGEHHGKKACRNGGGR